MFVIYMHFTCDIINIIYNLNLCKAINRNYFDVANNLITILWSIDFETTQ